ncbi:MAG: hypothetical protein K2P79_12210 [Sphingomonas sp.]|nr:hypothetical protein [Sphingomonas sp.]
MTIVERMKAFFFAKRGWRWLLLGVAIVAVGHYLEAKKIEPKTLADTGAKLTDRLHDRLALIQPQTISKLYSRAGADRHGIGICGPTAATGPLELVPSHLKATAPAPPPPITPAWRPSPTPGTPVDKAMAPLEREVGLPSPGDAAITEALRRARLKYPKPAPGAESDPFAPIVRITTDESYRQARENLPKAPAQRPKLPDTDKDWCRGGWLGVVDSAALTLRVTPEVGYAVWAGGGWSATILYLLTLLGMAAVLASMWTSKTIGGAVIPGTLAILAAGPFLAGGVFVVMLYLLLLLTAVLGKVLAGLAIVLAWITLGWKMVMFVVESLSAADDTHNAVKTLNETLGRAPPPGD